MGNEEYDAEAHARNDHAYETGFEVRVDRRLLLACQIERLERVLTQEKDARVRPIIARELARLRECFR